MNFLKYYLIVTENNLTVSGLQTINFLINNGITCLQIRFKTLPWAKKIQYGKLLQKWCHQLGVVFIVNDDLDLASSLNADGIHVGQQDTSVATCRRRLGPYKIIGLSIGSADELQSAKNQDVNYYGVGAIYHSESKPNAKIFKDFELLPTLNKPYVFIGGLNLDNIKILLQYHPKGMAFISLLINEPQAIFKLKTIY